MNIMATQSEVQMVLVGMEVIGLCLIFFAIGRGIFGGIVQYSKAHRLNAMVGLLGGVLFLSPFGVSVFGMASIRETSGSDDIRIEKERDHIKLDVPVTLSMSNVSVTTEDGEKLPFFHQDIDETHYVSSLCGASSWRYTAHRLVIDDKDAQRKKIVVAWDTEFGRKTTELAYPPRWFLGIIVMFPVVSWLLAWAVISYLLKRDECRDNGHTT